MEQFIQYLYEYEQGQKVRNVGFTKVRKYDSNCSVQIYGKGLEFGAKKRLEVLVIYESNGRCVGIPQGMIEGAAPIINYLLKFDAKDTDGEECYQKINGIVLQNEYGRRYAATWNEEAMDIGHMRVGEETVEEVPEESPQETAKETISESLIEHVERIVEEQTMEAAEEVERYQDCKEKSYEKIRRQDLARLPRRDWGVANNSFLLHGFYTYHHLMYLKEGEMCWLGVPGIFHEKERAIAESFGFPQFRRIEELDLPEEERNLQDDFGYWCRQVELRSL